MITIPLEAHLITLIVDVQRVVTRRIQVGRTTQTRRERVTEQREILPGETEAGIRTGVTLANRILAPTDISFSVVSISTQRINAPHNREVVTQNGFIFLTRKYPSRRGARLFVVRQFSGQEGGQAIEAQRVCILKHLGNPLFGKTLAHEFGHLLALGHVTLGASAHFNLMWPGLRAGDKIERSQIRIAQESGLARHFKAQRDT